eukprot:gene8419-5899_t
MNRTLDRMLVSRVPFWQRWRKAPQHELWASCTRGLEYLMVQSLSVNQTSSAMCMRRACACSEKSSSVIARRSCASNRLTARRSITSRGQFNPIHNFSYATKGTKEPVSEKEFQVVTSNPGPLRVGYSSDYLDWLYRSYKAKIKREDLREKTECKFQGQVLTSDTPNGGSSSLIGTGMQFLRPKHSIRRTAAERLREKAQETIDNCMIKQGTLDVFERQPQFPVIHINRADRYHIVELFKELLLDKALEPHEIWDKALLYRAILSERRDSYPAAFAYVFEAVDSTAFAPDASDEPAAERLFRKLPREDDYYYFLYLVKKFYVENAVEGHVVLRCHREPNSHNRLLFSVPPPKSDDEVRKAVQELAGAAPRPNTLAGSGKAGIPWLSAPDPSSYPPLEALWRCEENFPLLLVLVFGELNLMVTENPFVKFPNALPFLTRPYSTTEARGDAEDVSLAGVVESRRGPLLSIFRTLKGPMDARGNDLRRLRQRFHREDILAHQSTLTAPEMREKSGNYSSFSDWAYFNPRAVRAEERDLLQQKALEALKNYQQARKEIYRYSLDDAELSRSVRVLEGKNSIPTYIPSLPHFLTIVQRDRHISFLMNVSLPGQSDVAEGSTKSQRLEKLCYQLANALYRMALEFHKEHVRRINRQKVLVAAVLLDNFVVSEWSDMLEKEELGEEGRDGLRSLHGRTGRRLYALDGTWLVSRRTCLGHVVADSVNAEDDFSFLSGGKNAMISNALLFFSSIPFVSMVRGNCRVSMSGSLAALQKVLQGSNQEHILSHWEELTDTEKAALAKQITDIQNFSHLNLVLKESLALLDDASGSSRSLIEPPPSQCIFDAKCPDNKEKVLFNQRVGLEAVAHGRVAVLLMAGGSGTRLGVSIPKGMFSCPQLKQQKSLFQFHSEKILRVEELAADLCTDGKRSSIPFIIMTSEQNNEQTVAFFRDHNFFGLKAEQVFFFIQGSLPCYDEASGKILMESRSAMCLAPGGNGGIYQSFASSAVFPKLLQRGVEMVQIFGVDNLLAAVADPLFFGYALREQKEVAVKTTPKASPQERVGVFALIDKKWGVVEYTEIGAARSEEKNDSTGELRYNCANIATHVCSMRFLEFAAKKMQTETRFHAARKNISTIDGLAPAVKLEAFIFDMFAYCNDVQGPRSPGIDAFGILQVDRSEEFAPIKNADSAATDTPATAARHMQQLHSKWAQNVLEPLRETDPGARTALERLQKGEVRVEVSALVSYKGEGLEGHTRDLIAAISAAKTGDSVVLEKSITSNQDIFIAALEGDWVCSIPAGRLAALTRIYFMAKSGTSKLLKLQRGKRKANLSRKQIFEAQRKAWEKKKQAIDEAKREERRKKVEQLKKVQNKKSHREFDHSTLRVVQNGLTSAIEALGEQVQPLSVYMSAFTAASTTGEKKHIPYLLAIITACLPKLSQGVLLHETNKIFHLAEQLLVENGASDALITAKTMKLLQSLMLSFEYPSMDKVISFEKLQPSNLNVESTQLYLMSFRKFLEQAALASPSSAPPVKDAQSGYYTLNHHQLLFVEAAPHFVDVCLKNMIGTPAAVVSVTFHELSLLWERSLSPYIVESREGQHLMEKLLSHQFLSLMKPAYQHVWGMAMELFETFFSRINYLKRVSGNLVPFTARFPAVIFFIKVLHKLRAMNDSSLNGRVERAMVSAGKGMTVREFVDILPFDPQQAYEAEMQGDDADLWSTSYTLDIVRRCSSHDSLTFFKEYYFPSIKFCSVKAVEAEKGGQQEEFLRWSALLTQFWRIVVGFFHYPIEITDFAFRDIAKQLVGLLGNPTFVDTCSTAIHVLADGYYKLADAEEMEDEAFADDELEDEQLDDDLREKTRSRLGKRSVVDKTGLEEDVLFLSLNDPSWNPHMYHCISKERARDVCINVLGKYSANIMPKLCNVFESHNSMAVLLAIQSFSKVCKPEVMSTILNGILQVGSSIAADVQEKSEIYGGVKISTRGNHAPLSSKRRMILDIACAIVPQLSSDDIVRLFDDVIEPVLQDPNPDSRLLQKKAYKLLLSMFEHRVKDLFPFLNRVVGILSVGRQHVTISGMKMRLRCLSWALDACKMFYPDDMIITVRATVGEVMAFARERSNDTRMLTMDILEKMQRYLTALGVPVNTLLHMVIAGLAGKTPMMISSAVVCMAKLVFLTHESLPEKDLMSAIALGIQLMESKMNEVRAAASIFARMALKLSKRCPRVKTALQAALPKLLFAIALTTSQPRVSSNTRLEMRVLLEKTIKRFGYETIDPLFPIGSKNFLRYTQRMMRREEKKAERALKQRTESHKNEFEKLFMNARMNAGGEDAADMNLLEAGALNTFVSQHTAPVIPGFQRHIDDDDDYDNLHLDFVDGKFRIRSAAEHRVDLEIQRRQALAQQLLGVKARPMTAESLLERSRPGKRTRDELEDFENDELVLRYGGKATKEAAERSEQRFNAENKRVGPSTNQIQKLRSQKEDIQALKRQRVEEDIRKGEEFVGSGVGDVKRGNIEPYAYVPLNRRYMNRRNARQALHRFEVVTHKQLKGEKAKSVLFFFVFFLKIVIVFSHLKSITLSGSQNKNAAHAFLFLVKATYTGMLYRNTAVPLNYEEIHTFTVFSCDSG